MILTKEEQKLIVQSIKEIPPIEWIEDCETSDQKRHWHQCKAYFNFLTGILEGYFAGDTTLLMELPKKERQSFIRLRDWYLNLYGVIYDGWEYIEVEAKRQEIEIPSTPGDMFLEVLRSEAWAMFVVCMLPYHRWSPTEAYHFFREGRVIKALKTLARPLTKLEQNRIHQYETKERRRIDPQIQAYYRTHANFCLKICIKASSQDSNLKAKLSVLKKSAAEAQADLYSSIHPSKGVKGEAWMNGVLIPYQNGKGYPT